MSRSIAALVFLIAAFAAPAARAAPAAPKPPLVRTIVDPALGRVLTAGDRQALYVWDREPKGTIRCTGTCAKLWPPLIVKPGTSVPARVKGIKGVFGTIRRPGGARQVTLNGRALYAYAHEKPGQVLCDDVDDWFAIRIKG